MDKELKRKILSFFIGSICGGGGILLWGKYDLSIWEPLIGKHISYNYISDYLSFIILLFLFGYYISYKFISKKLFK